MSAAGRTLYCEYCLIVFTCCISTVVPKNFTGVSDRVAATGDVLYSYEGSGVLLIHDGYQSRLFDLEFRAMVIRYTKGQLFAIRRRMNAQAHDVQLYDLSVYGLLRYRGIRGGRRFKSKVRNRYNIVDESSNESLCAIPLVVSRPDRTYEAYRRPKIRSIHA